MKCNIEIESLNIVETGDCIWRFENNFHSFLGRRGDTKVVEIRI